MKPLVLYHSACRDGFCAAWIASHTLWKETEYLSVQYGSAPPEVLGRDVYVLDFCYSRAEMEHLATQAASLTVIDTTRRAALAGFA
jgi:hypothetical protein